MSELDKISLELDRKDADILLFLCDNLDDFCEKLTHDDFDELEIDTIKLALYRIGIGIMNTLKN